MKIFGLDILRIRKKDFLKELISLIDKKIIFTPNPEILLESQRDEKFKSILKKATYLLPDGIGLYIAFQVMNNKKYGFFNFILLPFYLFNLFFRKEYLYRKYGDRICGSDLTVYLLKTSQKNNIPITIIDLYVPLSMNNSGDILKKCSQKVFKKRLKREFPKLKFDYLIYKKEEKEEIINKIKLSGSKILFSTLGMKVQEKSIIEVMKKCDNLKLGLGVGSSFDYIIGFQKRAPQIWRSIGLEWLYRLFTSLEKINRLKRLWNAVFVFTWEVIVNKK